MNQTKQCSRCKKRLSKNNFYAHSSQCKECRYEMAKENYPELVANLTEKQKRQRTLTKERNGQRNRERWDKESPFDNPTPKQCSKCKILKDRKEFLLAYTCKDGLQSWCSVCRHQKHVDDPRHQILANARTRSKRYGYDFNLSLDDIIVPEFCPILGIKIEVSKLKQRVSHSSPSIDRIDNNKGYVKDNIRIISHRANSLKSDATCEELALILKDAQRIKNENITN